ncbi:MAG: hypothetical protein RL490_711 [Pseudomonadota bacterium]|jgi:hypothetical protein
MTITRHFVDVSNPDGSRRRVHYRRAGMGPPVLLIHQSPRSGAEYEALIAEWGRDFTCLAPDTPGFGESAPLPLPNPHVNDYADAVFAFMDALGLAQAGAYGTHSGAITLITAAKRQPQRFTAIAANGYAVWTDAERADFGANYTPPFVPLAYGEHLTWVWHRIREQSWFFPWYAADDAHRLGMAHDNVATNHAMVMDVLAAGGSYAQGYAAMLQAPRDLPEPGAPTPPVYIAGRNGDPLQAHVDRLGPLPPGWKAEKLVSDADVESASRLWLLAHAAAGIPMPRAPDDQGYVPVAGFGQLHWLGARDSGHLVLHAPGSAAEMVAGPGVLALDLPGHGLSAGFATAPASIDAIVDVLAQGLESLLTADLVGIEGHGRSHAIAVTLAERLGLPAPAAAATPAAGWPDLTPDRYGSHLTRAWAMARAEVAFAPWDAPAAANARAFDPAELAPQRLHRRALAALRARHMPELLQLLGE